MLEMAPGDEGVHDAAADVVLLANLTDDVVAGLVASLRAIAPGEISDAVLLEKLSEVFPPTGRGAAQRLGSVIWHVYEMAVKDDDDVAEIVDSFGDWLQSNDAMELGPWQIARERLVTLASIPSIFTAVKATDLQSATHSSVSAVRVLCDLRPIFAARIEDGPVGFTLLHTLELKVVGKDDQAPIYVTMSDDVLFELSEQVKRAVAKRHALKKVVDQRIGSSYIA